MRLPERIVPMADDTTISVCPDCLELISACTCIWKIMRLEPNYSIYPPRTTTALLSDDKFDHSTVVCSPLLDDFHKLDNLNCGGIPTRTTPTLTPTTLRNIASLSPGPSEDFAAAAASDLHHLVSSSCINVPSSGIIDRSDLQEDHSLQNLNDQQLSLSNQHTTDLPNHQLLNQNSLNQQQRNDYNNSFSTAASRQAGFVPPLVLQINSCIGNTQKSTGTILNNNASFISSKNSSNSSQWQGVVVTEKPHNSLKRCFTDDEGGDDVYDSEADGYSDCSETYSKKTISKQKSKSNVKIAIKSELKTMTNKTNSGRRSAKDNKPMSAEEEQRRQIRRERNKLAAARCRKRRMDHTNELLEETEQLEDKRLKLQDEIQGLRQQKTDLQQMLAHHKCAVNSRLVSNSINQALLDSISESDPNVLNSNDLSKRIICTNNIKVLKRENDSFVQSDKDNINVIPTKALQELHRTRPNTLSNLGTSKKISGHGSSGVVVLNFDSLMDGGTGLTPISSSGTLQNQQIEISNVRGNNNVLS